MKTIILAGGSGTRLWPLSRARHPKQFIKLQRDKPSLFQQTFERSLLLVELNDIYVVTNEKYKFLVMDAVEELGYDYNESNILVEPEAKNTLPAIYAGVHEIAKKGNDTIIVFPSDHIILKGQEFADIVKDSKILTKDSIITFGIKPTGPNTGYGYISPGGKKGKGYMVKEFKEKPDYKNAVNYIKNGYYWNSGIFMFDSNLFIEEVKTYAHEIFKAFETSTNINESFAKIEKKISIDYGLMEKSSRIAVVPADINWNDLGSFDSFYEVFDKDENNNIFDSDVIIIDSKNNYIYSEKDKLVSIVGVGDLIVVDNRDVLLICKKDKSQKINEIVEILKARKDNRTEHHI